MDISRDINTDLLIRHGDLQTSPRQAALLNERPHRLFISIADAAPTSAGYQVTLTGYAEFVRLREREIGRYSVLDLLLRTLRANPRSLSAKILKGSVSTYRAENEAYIADYRVANGQVVVYNIQLVDRLQRQRNQMERVALYRVKRNQQGVWQVAGKAEAVSTTFAAVNGQSNNLAKATWLMGAHLEYEFKNLQEYTLFHNPSVGFAGDCWESFRDKMGITTPVTRQFAKALMQAQSSGNKTQWVAHSQGALIFAEGVRYLLNGSSSWATNKLYLNGMRHPAKGELLDEHSVAFHGSANNTLRTDPLLARAGIKVIAVRNHDYDLVPNILGANTLNPRKLFGSLVYANHVIAGSVFQSPHTLPQSKKDWNKNMENGPGKGRNGLQRAFHKVADRKAKATPNYLP